MSFVKYIDVVGATIPTATRSYQPVSNINLIDAIKEELYKNNLIVCDERYQMNATRSQMFGVFDITTPDNDFKMNVGFRNSYDKSLPVGLVAGSTVIVCSNLMFKGDIKILRKHTSGVYRDLKDIIKRSVEIVDVEFEEIKRDSETLKKIEMPRLEMAYAAGDLFINRNLINSHQMSIVKNEIKQSEKFTGESRWDFYNHLTEALKVEHPSFRMRKQIDVHKYMLQLN